MATTPPSQRAQGKRPKLLVTGEAGFRGADAALTGPLVVIGVIAFATFTAVAGFSWHGDAASPAALQHAAQVQQTRNAVAPATLPSNPVVTITVPAATPPPPRRRPVPTAAAPASVPVNVQSVRLDGNPPPETLSWAAARAVGRLKAAPVKPGDAPMLAVVIDDLGFDVRRTERLAAMPGPISFAFLPYARRVAAQARFADSAGHVVLLHMPMEPRGPENPGPHALRLSDDAATLRWKLDRALLAVPGAVGMNNHMGSLMTASATHMGVVADVLRQNGMIFLDSRTSGRAIAAEVAAQRGGAWAVRDIFIDDDASPLAIDRQLQAAERLAWRRGYAVAIGHPYDATLNALEYFLPAAQARGVRLVSIETIAALNGQGTDASVEIAQR